MTDSHSFYLERDFYEQSMDLRFSNELLRTRVDIRI